jgi:hypothetical protein
MFSLRERRRKLLLGNYAAAIAAATFPALAYYWDNRFLNQVYQELARQNLAASGVAIGSWTDRVSSAHLGQPTAGNKPLNRLASGIEFDGTDDFLTATIAEIPANGFTIYYRAFPDDFDAVQVHLDWGDMTISSSLTTGTVAAARSGFGAIGTSTGALTVLAVNTIGFRYNKTTGAWRWCVNSITPNTGTQIHAVTGTALHVGAENGGSFRFDGKILSIAIHTAAHSNAVMDKAMSYWRSVA